MNRTLVFLLASAIAASSAIGLYLLRSSRAHQAEVAAERVKVEEAARALAEAQAAQKQTEAQRDQLMKLADQVGTKLREANSNSAALQASAAAAAASSASGEPKQEGFGKLVSKMMSDPDTRKFIHDQQRVAMDQLYSPLVKKLGLSAEEATRLKDLLADHMMASSEKAMEVMGDKTARDKTKAISGLTEGQKQFDEEVRSLLGESRYNQYAEYQETLGERAQLNMFRQSNSGDKAISEAQTDQLLALMAQEKKAVQAATGNALLGGDQAAATQAMLSEEQAGKLLETQELVNQRVYEHAGEILSPEQLQSFAQFQTNQLQMLRMGVSMARKMFSQ
jgi:hypothetical protein